MPTHEAAVGALRDSDPWQTYSTDTVTLGSKLHVDDARYNSKWVLRSWEEPGKRKA